MRQVFSLVLTTLICSLYLFSFEFIALPGINTKMMLATLGLIVVIVKSILKKPCNVEHSFLIVSIIASIFSLWSFFSIVYNGTFDNAYTNYIISMWVWLGGAYFVCFIINTLYGECELENIFKFIILVCVCQCVIVLLNKYIPSVKEFIDSYVAQGQVHLDRIHRLYGVGSALDVAGSRFGITLLIISTLIVKNMKDMTDVSTLLYLFAFIFISIVGNMVARTTTVGMLVAMVYFLGSSGIFKKYMSYRYFRAIGIIILTFIVITPMVLYFYIHDTEFHKLFRFAFEGFFNWIEQGKWVTDSTHTLSKDFYRWPTETKTWVVGDGYFSNPDGPGFYKDVDMGYLRFIYYCGIIGLLLFNNVFVGITFFCVQAFKKYKSLFILTLMIQFIIWVKVSTDIFLFFALFLCCSYFMKTSESREESLSNI